MTRRRLIVWLHRLGYFTTAIVAFEAFAFSALMYVAWEKGRESNARGMADSRTHRGPLAADQIRYRPDDLDLLATLPPLAPNALRFVAQPSLRDTWFAVGITASPEAKRATGVIKIIRHPKPETIDLEIVRTIPFTASNSAAQRLVSRIKFLTADWEGESSGCLDGTGVAFELAREGRVISGHGNSACSEHYGTVSLIVLKAVGHLIPPDVRPVGANWRPILRPRPK